MRSQVSMVSTASSLCLCVSSFLWAELFLLSKSKFSGGHFLPKIQLSVLPGSGLTGTEISWLDATGAEAVGPGDWKLWELTLTWIGGHDTGGCGSWRLQAGDLGTRVHKSRSYWEWGTEVLETVGDEAMEWRDGEAMKTETTRVESMGPDAVELKNIWIELMGSEVMGLC